MLTNQEIKFLPWTVFIEHAIMSRGLYTFTPFFIAGYIVEWLVFIT